MQFSRRHFLAASATTTAMQGMGCANLVGGTNQGLPWHIGFQNAPADGFDATPMRLVQGKAPKSLKGILYRNGPSHFLYGNADYTHHWFDGDGFVHRIAIEDGQAVHSGRFVQTNKRLIEQKHMKFMAPGFGSSGDPAFPVTAPDDANAANTSVMVVNGELLALWEAGSAYSIDADTLETKGPKVWRGDLKGMPFLAHPKIDPDGTIWNLSMYGAQVGVYKIGKGGDLKSFDILNIETASLIHDWAMTDRHLIIMVQPWINERFPSAIIDGYKWQPELGFRFLIVDKTDFTKRRWAQGPARAFFHTGAAWEDKDDTIHIDAGLYEKPTRGVDGGMLEIKGEWSQLDTDLISNWSQIVIPLSGDARLIETGLEGYFPQVHPQLHGLPRKLTAMTSKLSKLALGATKLCVHDWQSGLQDSFEFGEGKLVEEFLFVPKSRSTKEEDSWLIGPVLNLVTQTTDICVFDTARISDGPICTWRAGYSWPLGFHGTWV